MIGYCKFVERETLLHGLPFNILLSKYNGRRILLDVGKRIILKSTLKTWDVNECGIPLSASCADVLILGCIECGEIFFLPVLSTVCCQGFRLHWHGAPYVSL